MINLWILHGSLALFLLTRWGNDLGWPKDCLTSAVAAWNFISNYWSEMTHIECGLLSRRSGHPEGLKTFMSNIKEHIAPLGPKRHTKMTIWQAAWQSNMFQHVGPELFESWEKLTQTQKQVVFSWLSCFKFFPYFLFCPSTRNLQQLIETVNVRVQELARQIHHNDLQLERLNLEKKEAQHGRAIEQRHIFLGSWPVLTYFLTGDFGHLRSAE